MPPTSELDVLTSLAEQFAHSNAEDEQRQLPAYFVETPVWEHLLSGNKDIVKGAKGTGKSTLHALLLRQAPQLLATRRLLIVAAERPLGAPHFENALKSHPASEGALTYEQFQGLWDRYFLTLIVAALRDKARTNESIKAQLHRAPAYRQLVKALVREGLLPEHNAGVDLRDVLSRVFRSVRVSGQLGPFTLIVEQTGDRPRGGRGRAMETSELLSLVNGILSVIDLYVWISFDRLDDAFQTLPSRLETAALYALLTTYRNWRGHERIGLKLFVRSDIYRRTLRAREASRGTATGAPQERIVLRILDRIEGEIDLTWSSAALLNILMRRVLLSSRLRETYGLSAANARSVRDDYDEQKQLFNRLFPDTVDHQDTWTWIQEQLKDGFGNVAPRDMIKFMRHTVEHQLVAHRRDEADRLFDQASLVQAAYDTSQEHYERAFMLEYRDLPDYTDVFPSKMTGYTLGTLVTMWGVSAEEAKLRAKELIEVGFFSISQHTDDYDRYRIAPLYRRALNVREEDSTSNPIDKRLRRV